MLSLLAKAAFSEDLSRILAMVGHMNMTISSSRTYTGQYLNNPLITALPRSGPSSMSISAFRFINLSSGVFYGFGLDLSINKCLFKNSFSPITVAASERSKLRAETQRRSKEGGSLSMKDTVFDFCSSLNEIGGSIYIESCNLLLDNVEFIHSSATSAGAIAAKSSEMSITSCTFFKCDVRKDCGAILARDCSLKIVKSYFVGNRALEKYGVIYQSGRHFHIFANFFYENSARRAFAGITTEDSTGQITANKFVENRSPTEEGGMSIYVKSSRDYVFIEYNVFGGQLEKYIKFREDSSMVSQENCFDIDHQFTRTSEAGAAGSEVTARWGNNKYAGECTPAPKLPARFSAELFHHPAVAPQIEWWKLYVGMAVFVLMVGIMAFSVPAIFFPYVTPGATRRGESIN